MLALTARPRRTITHPPPARLTRRLAEALRAVAALALTAHTLLTIAHLRTTQSAVASARWLPERLFQAQLAVAVPVQRLERLGRAAYLGGINHPVVIGIQRRKQRRYRRLSSGTAASGRPSRPASVAGSGARLSGQG